MTPEDFFQVLDFSRLTETYNGFTLHANNVRNWLAYHQLKSIYANTVEIINRCFIISNHICNRSCKAII